ncbi:MAG: MgtC/SapB family protein [Clostridia bacterium]|nr:MgtC/SapB family protein [Clostridia bacterium]
MVALNVNIFDLADPISKLLGDWSSHLDLWSIILRIVVSVVFSAIIGWERSTKRHAAGLRTFMLVSLSATMATLLDLFLIGKSLSVFPILSAAFVIGIAIISSNSILFSSKSQIKGLTTAVGLWSVGFMGLLIGAGFYTVSLIGFIALISCLSLFPTLERRFKNKSNHFEIHLELKHKDDLQNFVTTIRKLGLRIDDIEVNPAYIHSGLSVYSIALTIQNNELKTYKTHTEIIEALRSIEYVHHIEEMT